MSIFDYNVSQIAHLLGGLILVGMGFIAGGIVIVLRTAFTPWHQKYNATFWIMVVITLIVGTALGRYVWYTGEAKRMTAIWNRSYADYQAENSVAIAVANATRTKVERQLRRYELVEWNPPKHFYVTLMDVETKQMYPRTYVSKHCNASNQLKKGDEYNLNITVYEMTNEPGVRRMEFNKLYEAFCS